MAAGKFDLAIEQGATFTLDLTWRQDTGTTPPSGPIVDLTGCSARAQFRASVADSVVLHELNTTAGEITLYAGSVSPNIHIEISATNTATFSWSTAVWDLEITTPSGNVTRLLKGNVTVDPEVTR